MSQLLLDKLKVKDYKRGYVKLSDDTIAILRVSIVDVKPIQTPLQFDVITIGGISVIPSEDARKEVKNKPLAEPNEINNRKLPLLHPTADNFLESIDLAIQRNVDIGDAVLASIAESNNIKKVISNDEDWDRLSDYVSVEKLIK